MIRKTTVVFSQPALKLDPDVIIKLILLGLCSFFLLLCSPPRTCRYTGYIGISLYIHIYIYFLFHFALTYPTTLYNKMATLVSPPASAYVPTSATISEYMAPSRFNYIKFCYQAVADAIECELDVHYNDPGSVQLVVNIADRPFADVQALYALGQRHFAEYTAADLIKRSTMVSLRLLDSSNSVLQCFFFFFVS